MRLLTVLVSLLIVMTAPCLATDPTSAPWSQHEIRSGGQSLRYEAQAGFLDIDAHTPGSHARVFYVAYRRLNAGLAEHRPITFAYNGGPGGSSAAIHIGAFGPRVLPPIDPHHVEAGDIRLVDNPDTLLGASDLVFIDPVGSGYSRLEPGTAETDFYGVRQDAAATAAFVVAYLRQERRQASPLFLMGESYGTMRTVLTARLLQRQGVHPRGLALMGLILDNTTLFPQPGNDEPFWLFLPTEAAVAAYHAGAASSERLPRAVASARRYALGGYLDVLAQGSSLDDRERGHAADRLGALIGLAPGKILTADLRVTPDEFARDLLGGGIVVSRADGRVTGPDRGSGPSGDPLYAAMLPRYRNAIVPYLHDELGFTGTTSYQILDTGISDVWQWGDTPLGSPTALSVGGQLRDALRADPNLAVFLANGTFDLTSPTLAAEYTINHLGLRRDELSRIKIRDYASGHMIYVSQPERQALLADLERFEVPRTR